MNRHAWVPDMTDKRTNATDAQRPLGLIGGVGMTEVHVYAQRKAPDGHFSGCPHVHAATDEAYYVLRGGGWVEFHDLVNGFRKLSLRVGVYAHFPPMVMHRLVSDGDLVVLGVMGNAGMAEQGEARIYFGEAVDEDEAQFDRLTSLPSQHGMEGALDRRDAAVKGYMELMRLWKDDRSRYITELRRFFDRHCLAMSALASQLSGSVEHGPMAWARATQSRIDHLPTRPDVKPHVSVNVPGFESALGMCGVLRPMRSLAYMDSHEPSLVK